VVVVLLCVDELRRALDAVVGRMEDASAPGPELAAGVDVIDDRPTGVSDGAGEELDAVGTSTATGCTLYITENGIHLVEIVMTT